MSVKILRSTYFHPNKFITWNETKWTEKKHFSRNRVYVVDGFAELIGHLIGSTNKQSKIEREWDGKKEVIKANRIGCMSICEQLAIWRANRFWFARIIVIAHLSAPNFNSRLKCQSYQMAKIATHNHLISITSKMRINGKYSIPFRIHRSAHRIIIIHLL